MPLCLGIDIAVKYQHNILTMSKFPLCVTRSKFCLWLTNSCDRVSEGGTYFTAFMCVDEQSKNLKCIFTVNPEKRVHRICSILMWLKTAVMCIILVSCKCHLRGTSMFPYMQKKKRERREKKKKREGRKAGRGENQHFCINQNKLFSICYKQ